MEIFENAFIMLPVMPGKALIAFCGKDEHACPIGVREGGSAHVTPVHLMLFERKPPMDGATAFSLVSESTVYVLHVSSEADMFLTQDDNVERELRDLLSLSSMLFDFDEDQLDLAAAAIAGKVHENANAPTAFYALRQDNMLGFDEPSIVKAIAACSDVENESMFSLFSILD